jgi:hypothetical protein
MVNVHQQTMAQAITLNRVQAAVFLHLAADKEITIMLAQLMRTGGHITVTTT